MAGDGIIRTSIVVDNTSVKSMMQSIKELKAAVADLKAQGKGSATMFNGELAGVKELQGVIKQLQADMKALRNNASPGKSNVTKGVNDAVDETSAKLKTLQAKVREAMVAADKAWQSGSGFKTAKDSFGNALNQLTAFKRDLGTLSIGQEKSLYSNLRRGLDEGSASAKVLTERIKELNAETARNKAIDSPKVAKVESINSSQITDGIKQAKQNILAIDRQIFEQLQKNNGAETQRTAELRRQKAELESQVNALKTPKTVPSYQGYTQQISAAKAKTEELYQVMLRTNNAQSKLDFATARTGLMSTIKESNAFNASLGIGIDRAGGLGSLMQKLRSHTNWIIAGGMISAAVGIPMAYISTLKEIEVGMAGISQVLPAVHGNQVALNQVSREFVGIAQEYGESVNGVIEAGKLWGRAYKDIPTLMAFTSASAKLAVADNFGLAESNKALEATLAQYEWRAKSAAEATAYSMRVVDTWTAVAHNAQVSAQDLAMANERTAGVARMVGVEFEFLQAMVAAGVKNTGRSGQEIGNTLKTVFGSIHSDKAVGEIEAIGVAMKTTAADGTQKWRKVQDVIVDLAIATRATTKDVEGLFKAAAGGKFQWAKFSSMLDYDELIKVYAIAVNSAGTTEKQIAMQMDTISRKVEQLKATMVGLTTNSGGTLAKFIKDAIDNFSRFINILNNVSTTTYTVASKMLGAALVVAAGVKVWQQLGIVLGIYRGALLASSVATNVNTASQALNTGAQISGAMAQGAKTGASVANTVATNVNTAAQVRNAIATTIATGGLNLIIPVLAASAIALMGYSAVTGDATNSTDKLGRSLDDLGKMQEETGIKENLIQSLKQRYDYVDTLTNAHDKLTIALSKESEGSKEYNKLQKSLGATQEQLANIVGVTTGEIVQDGVLRMDLINQEKTNMETKAEGIKKEISNLKVAQIKYTEQSIQSAQDRIDALGTETKAWGLLAQAQMWAMEQYAGVMDLQIAAKQFIYDQTPDTLKTEASRASIQSDKDYRESLRNYKPTSVTEEINANAQKITDLGLKKAQIAMSNIDYDTTNSGATVNPDDPAKPKAEPGLGAKDTAESTAEKLELHTEKRKLAEILHNAKLADNVFSELMDNIKSYEEIHGEDSYSILEYMRTRADKVKLLKLQNETLENDIGGLDVLIDAYIATNAELSGKLAGKDAKGNTLGYGDMTKNQKTYQRTINADLVSNDSNLSAYTGLRDKAEEKQGSNNVEITKLNNDNDRIAIGDTQNRSKVHSRNLDAINLQSDSKDANDFSNDPLVAKEAALRKFRVTATENYRYLGELESNLRKAKLIEVNEEDALLRAAAMEQVRIAQEAYDKQRLIIDKAYKEQANAARAKDMAIRESWYSVADDMIVKGNTLRSIVDGLWKGLASDALKAITGVSKKGEEGTMFQTLQRLMHPKSDNGTQGRGGNIPVSIGRWELPQTGTNSDWQGISDKYSVKPKTNYFGLASQLGIFKGTNVVASVSPRTTATANAIAGKGSNYAGQLSQMQTQLGQVVQVLTYMANNNAAKSATGTNVAVLQQGQSNESFANQLNIVKSLGLLG